MTKHTASFDSLAARRSRSPPARSRRSVRDKHKDDDKKPAPQAPGVSDEYRLGPGDKLRIEVYKDPQLSQSVQVRPDGKITLPLVGDVDATGQHADRAARRDRRRRSRSTSPTRPSP